MFALHQHWSTPHEAFAKWRWKFPTLEELQQEIEKQVHESLHTTTPMTYSPWQNDMNLEVESIQFVLEVQGYEQLKQTATELYGLTTTTTTTNDDGKQENEANEKDENDLKKEGNERDNKDDEEKDEDVTEKKKDLHKSKNRNNVSYTRDGLIQPLLVYHCTQNVNKVNSILRHGYLIPGQSHPTQGWTLRMQNGNRYGNGIYASPHLDLAKWYSFVDYQQSIQLIVNLLLPGQTLVVQNDKDNREPQNQTPQESVFLNVDRGTYTLTTLCRLQKDKDKGKDKDKDKGDKKKDPSATTIRTPGSNQEEEDFIVTEDTFHTLRSPDMSQWVCASSRRIIPVALVTLRPNVSSSSIAMQQFRQTQQRRQELKQCALLQPGHAVFTHFGYDLHLLITNRLERRTSLLYDNAYSLLIATVLLAQHRDEYRHSGLPWDESVQFINAITTQLFRFEATHGPEKDDKDKDKDKNTTRMNANHHPRDLLERVNRFTNDHDRVGALVPASVMTLSLTFSGCFTEQNRCAFAQCIIQTSQVLVQDCDGQVPSNRERLECLFGRSVVDLWEDYVATDKGNLHKEYATLMERNKNDTTATAASKIPRHFMVVPLSLFATHAAFAKSVAHFLNGLPDSTKGGQVAVEKYLVVENHRALEKGKKAVGVKTSTVGAHLHRLVNHDSAWHLHLQSTKPSTPKNAKGSENQQKEPALREEEAEEEEEEEEGTDNLLDSVSQVVDHLTEEDDNDKYVNLLYLVVDKKPRDLHRISEFVQQWEKYLQVKHTAVQIIFLKDVYHDICRLKSHLQTMPTTFPDYFHQSSLADVNDVLQHMSEQVKYQFLSQQSVPVAVPFPFGVVGEGFLQRVELEPCWDVAVPGEAVLFQGCPPDYIRLGSTHYKTSIHQGKASTQQVEQFAHCILQLLAVFQNFLFRSPERVGIYGNVIERLAHNLLQHMEQSQESMAPSVWKGIRHKLAGFLRSMQILGRLSFRGKWYSNLLQMKHGEKIARRVAGAPEKSNFCSTLEDLPSWLRRDSRVREPSDALSVVPLSGRPIRVHSFAGSQIEPWLIVVDYVSLDDESVVNPPNAGDSTNSTLTTVDMFLSGERGTKQKDSRNRIVSDVLLMDLCPGGDLSIIAKLYHGYVFTRTPYLYMPSQHPALVVNAFMTCIETAFRLCVENRQRQQQPNTTNGGGGVGNDQHRDHSPPPGPPACIPKEVKDEVAQYVHVAFGMLDRVCELMSRNPEALGWIEGVTKDENVEKYLTEAYGVQSMNQFLAALMLPQAAHLTLDDKGEEEDDDDNNNNDNDDNQHHDTKKKRSKWSRLCFGVLAEAVMRNCRARVKAGKYSAEQLIDRVLSITRGSTAENYVRHIKRCSQRTNSSMTHSFTNCSPFKAVGVLYFMQHLHHHGTTTAASSSSAAERICDAYLSGEASMGRFLRDFLPGFGGYITQLALYLQGMDSQKAKYRQELQFDNPKQVVDRIIQLRLQHYEVERLQNQRTHHRVEQRRLIRWAQAQPFAEYHAGSPRLFTPQEVEQLNAKRPVDNQLELLETGLLKHHCCYPNCPDYLSTHFQTDNDCKRNSRRGLMRHLRHDVILGIYEKNWHVVCHKHAYTCSDLPSFVQILKREFPHFRDCEEHAPLQYQAYQDWRARGGGKR